MRIINPPNINAAYTANDLKTLVQKDVVRYLPIYKHLIVTAYTGFGKTNIGAIAIQDKLNQNPYSKIIIVSPGSLVDKWKKVASYYSNTIEVYSINYYTINLAGINFDVDLLIVDEAHNILNEESEYFSTVLSKTESIESLLLSGSVLPTHLAFLEATGKYTRYNITKYWAFRHKLVPLYHIINIPVDFTYREKTFYMRYDRVMKTYYPKLQAAGLYNLYETDDNVIENVADNLGWRVGALRKILKDVRSAVNGRKSLSYNAEGKAIVTLEILKHIKEKALIFCMTSAFADKLAEQSPLVVAYHNKSKKPKDIIERFNSNTQPHLASVNMFKEGKDYPELRFALRTSFTSTTTDTDQILGRVFRLDLDNPNKEAIVVSLYAPDFEGEEGKIIVSQEQKWLVKSQANQPNAFWAKTVNEGIEKIKQILYG